MAHPVKCYYCKQKFDRDKIACVQLPDSRRYAHIECAEKAEQNPDSAIIIDPTRKKKCAYCGKWIDIIEESNSYVRIHGGLFAHTKCREDYLALPKDSLEELKDYITELLDIPFCSPGMVRIINRYQENEGFTYSGMHKTLYYIFNIKKIPIRRENLESLLGLIPYNYYEAQNYYYNIWLANSVNQEKNIEDYIPKEIEIHITPPQREIKKRKLFSFLDEEVDIDVK